MKSLYGQYIEEREDGEILEYFDSDGIPMCFGTYKFQKLSDGTESLYLMDVYVRPDSRKLGLCSRIVSDIIDIAKVCDNCSSIVTSCDLRANACTESLAVILSCGFRVHSNNESMVFFKREL